jgi:hypothetical protein
MEQEFQDNDRNYVAGAGNLNLAELDAIIAHLYGLTEPEFAHILSTFPIVPQEVKAAVLAEFKRRSGIRD